MIAPNSPRDKNLADSHIAASLNSWKTEDLNIASDVNSNNATASVVDFALLSERELEAVAHMLAVKSSKESAALMGLKDSTVRNYLQRSYKKLGFNNAQQLRAAVIDQSLANGLCNASYPSSQDIASIMELSVFGTLCCDASVSDLSCHEGIKHQGMLTQDRDNFRSVFCKDSSNDKSHIKFRPSEGLIYQAPGNFLHLGLLMLFFLALGFVTGELGRGSTSLLANCSLLLFLGTSAFMTLVVLARKEAMPLVGFILVCMAMFLFSVFGGVKSGLFLGLVASLCIWLVRCRPLSLRVSVVSLLVFAVGLAGGRYVIMTWKDALLYEAYSLAIYGDATTASAFVPAMAVLMLALGAICIVIDGLVFGAPNQPIEALQQQSVKEKIRLYFASQGLEGLESSVLLLILAGDTGPVIAQKLNYSYGSVNNARNNAYKALNIHSKQELAQLVDRHVLHADRGGQPSS